MSTGIVLYGKDNKIKTELLIGENATSYDFPDSALVNIDDVASIVEEKRTSALVNSLGSNKPTILSPSNNSTGFIGYVNTSSFSISGPYLGTHATSDYELAYDPDFKELVDSSYGNQNLLSFSFTLEKPNTVHYIRCRHNTSSFKGDWSDTVKVTSANVYVSIPVITVSELTNSGNLLFKIDTSAFQSVNIENNVHNKTRYMISNNIDFDNVIADITSDKLLSISVGKDSDINIDLIPGTTYFVKAKHIGNFYNSVWSIPVSFQTVKTLPTPVLKGPTLIDEGKVARISIVNYNFKNNYEVFVNAGNAIIKGNIIEWTLPFVDNDASLTLGVISKDSSNNAIISKLGTFNIKVLNRLAVTDATIQYDGTNFNALFLKTNMDTFSQVLKPKNSFDIMAHVYPSSQTTYWVNNKYIELREGDILTDSLGNDVVVKNICLTGTLRTDYDEYNGAYWFTPETPLAKLPTALYLKHGRAKSKSIIQEDSEKDFIGVKNSTLKEVIANIMIMDNGNTVSSIHIDTSKITPYKNMPVVTSDSQVAYVESYDKVSGVITLDRSLSAVPTTLYALSTLRVNNVLLSIDNVVISGINVITTFIGCEFSNTRTINTIVDTPFTNEVTNIDIPVNMLS